MCIVWNPLDELDIWYTDFVHNAGPHEINIRSSTLLGFEICGKMLVSKSY